MTVALLGSVAGTLLGWLMGFLSLFLIMLILIQRGKGGGLTGALGGPGGQSAFGSKAGDTFTVITVVVASIWGFTCAFTMWLLGTHSPTTMTDTTTLSAGPDDENAETPPPIDPLGSAGGILDGLDLGTDSIGGNPGTPSVDLTPKDSSETAEDSNDSAPTGETPDASESTDPPTPESTDSATPESTDSATPESNDSATPESTDSSTSKNGGEESSDSE